MRSFARGTKAALSGTFERESVRSALFVHDNRFAGEACNLLFCPCFIYLVTLYKNFHNLFVVSGKNNKCHILVSKYVTFVM